MTGPTLEELRELSQRSRRAQRWGVLAILSTLLLVPLGALLQGLVAAAWVQYGTVLAGGVLFLAYAYFAGEERGAFRRVFRRVKEDARVRTLFPEGPSEAAPAPQPPVRAK